QCGSCHGCKHGNQAAKPTVAMTQPQRPNVVNAVLPINPPALRTSTTTTVAYVPTTGYRPTPARFTVLLAQERPTLTTGLVMTSGLIATSGQPATSGQTATTSLPSVEVPTLPPLEDSVASEPVYPVTGEMRLQSEGSSSPTYPAESQTPDADRTG